MGKYTLDLEQYAATARRACADGCVLIKNDNEALPLKKGDKVAVFGRIAFTYYKSGLGSGGLVNTKYVVGILDALKAEKEISLNEKVLSIYEEWLKENPFDEGEGWGRVPWCQKEMEIDDTILEAAKDSDAAVVIIGRTAGEDQDNRDAAGSYQMTDLEKDMVAKVSKAFKRTIVVLNVGNTIDMKWVEEYNPAAVLYAWQGGQEGGNGVTDVLMGRVNPSGKLTDTIARNIEDYPSTPYFGNLERNFYVEDIYVGYRYFETFAKEKVLYPFGFGLSYTTFSTKTQSAESTKNQIVLAVKVTNTGAVAGREVVQVYMKAPMGKLGKPARVLIGFGKTKELQPGEDEVLNLAIDKSVFASYDDSGVTGHQNAFVLEEGTYEVYVGNDVRSAELVYSYEEEFTVVEQLKEACAPVLPFERMKAEQSADGSYQIAMQPVPLRAIDLPKRIADEMPAEIPYTGDKGYKLGQVLDGEVSMDDFVAQLDDNDLIYMFHGEGMCSPKVTPGTAAAFGGVTDKLLAMDIPTACCADGPSGIRMDCGTSAFSLPNGTALGCSFDLELVEKLFHFMGLELRKNKIDTLLGPGINIHRNPLNGRNFEYVSEDPLLTGKIAAAQLLGMEESSSTGTIKHYATNNQESGRQHVDAVVSQRALREIYLKGFEIAVKEGKCRTIMTTYGPLNGLWTAGSYDLNTTILRNEWGFKGIVMTDWWAMGNVEGEDGSREMHAPMVQAQNDIYMVTPDATDLKADNVKEELDKGTITRAQLQRNAKNILGFILKSPSILHKLNRISQEELDEMKSADDDALDLDNIVFYAENPETKEVVIKGDNFDTSKGHSELFAITVDTFGEYEVEISLKSQLGELAQLPVSIYYDNVHKATISIQGSEGKVVTESRPIGYVFGKNHYIKLYFGANGIEVDQIVFRPLGEE